ncbi:electron transfer flavoprotein subunit alpha [Oxalicibacterium flavum]|uniref:Electron transfer flavoprotein subunit alpha n=1 Tax=Oxalicibacterium flavum TaxID=179467 RepID=A0A8J2XZQ9_9BURK|nr:FAD-binding protein [Oxalicibacterium flavum]GGC14245.1 electron transfer flavoprotein subunit alpha [Oxalicibacterium flavum]
MSVLVIAEQEMNVLKPAALHAVTAARCCAEEVHLLLVGAECEAAAQQAACIVGVAQVLLADAPQLKDALPEIVAQQVLALLATGHYTHVLSAATAWGKSVLPRVAASLDAGQISDVTAILSPDTFERPIYAGNAIATVRSLDAIRVLTVRAVSFAAAATGTQQAPVQRIAAANEGDGARARFVSRALLASERPELASAAIVVAGGRGLGSAEHFRLLEPLADRLGAAMGASRAAVDAGFAANDLQVGQTGKVVAPDLYLAIGISGAVQHLAGMSGSRIIVAINKDAEAPIFSVADYGIVGDLFEEVPALLRALDDAQVQQAMKVA